MHKKPPLGSFSLKVQIIPGLHWFDWSRNFALLSHNQSDAKSPFGHLRFSVFHALCLFVLLYAFTGSLRYLLFIDCLVRLAWLLNSVLKRFNCQLCILLSTSLGMNEHHFKPVSRCFYCFIFSRADNNYLPFLWVPAKKARDRTNGLSLPPERSICPCTVAMCW